MTIDQCKIVELPKIVDPRGNLTVIENSHQIPFDIKRVYYIYEVPDGELRAGHALISCHKFLIAITGSFDLLVDDGCNKKSFSLNRANFGIYVPPLIWRELGNFSTGAVCLVLASDFYHQDDYYRNYQEYLRAINLTGNK